MKRNATLALLLACLVFFSPRGLGNADEEQHKKPRPPKWENLSEGIQVMKLWKSSDAPKWPQVAVLLLSGDEYKKYLDAPEDYVNGYKVFAPSSTHRIFGCDYARPPKAPPKVEGGAQCMVIISHEQATTSTGNSSCSLGW